MGSKIKIAKHILPHMLAQRTPEMTWVEPFVGGANVIDKVRGKRIGNDINPYLIALLQNVQYGWHPPEGITEAKYNKVRENQNKYSDCMVGYVAICCSYGGKWWGGFSHSTPGRDYIDESRRNLIKSAKQLKGIEFRCGDYKKMDIPPNSLIYCDPPYDGTTDGYMKNKFKSKDFWKWCRKKSKEGHIVFISEYSAPEDAQLVMERKCKTTMMQNESSDRVERLFVLSEREIIKTTLF